MRRIRTVAAGISIAATAHAGLAQDAPRPAPAPAASIGRIQVIDGPPVARAQATDPMKVPAPAQPTPPAPNLQMPRPLPTGPGVTEYRGPNGTVYPAPAVTFSGSPIAYGGPVSVGSPVPVGAPVPVGPPVAVGPPVTAPSVLPAEAAPAPAPTGAAAPFLGGLFGTPYGSLTGPNKLQLEADFLMWFLRTGAYPPLVTTSAPSQLGILGQPSTQVLFGNDPYASTLHYGGRFGGVYWFGNQQKWGLDANLFVLGQKGTEFTATTGEYPLLARPFFNVNQGIPFSEVVAAPGLATGSVQVNAETNMYGAEFNLRRYLGSTQCARIDMFGGYRTLIFNESVSITENFARTPNSPLSIGAPNALFGSVNDQFRTENSFHGGQIGFAGEVRRGRWFLEGRAAIALGVVNQSLQVSGVQNIQYTTGPAVVPGGLLALPGANIGTFDQEKFGVIPEVGFKLGYHLSPRWRVSVGYNFMYVSSVLRPGDNIDTGLDVTRIPNFPLPGAIPAVGGVRPAVTLRDTGLFAQGVSFSVQFNF